MVVVTTRVASHECADRIVLVADGQIMRKARRALLHQPKNERVRQFLSKIVR